MKALLIALFCLLSFSCSNQEWIPLPIFTQCQATYQMTSFMESESALNEDFLMTSNKGRLEYLYSDCPFIVPGSADLNNIVVGQILQKPTNIFALSIQGLQMNGTSNPQGPSLAFFNVAAGPTTSACSLELHSENGQLSLAQGGAGYDLLTQLVLVIAHADNITECQGVLNGSQLVGGFPLN